MKIYELNSLTVSTYSKNRLIYTNVQSSDKSLDKTINHSNPFDLLSPFTPYAVHNENLICLTYPLALIQNFERNGRLVKKTRSDDYDFAQKLCSEIKMDENPVLLNVRPHKN